MQNAHISIFDTTLRDGEQAPGCSMTSTEKLRLARQLDALGVDIIEAGFAVVSEDDASAISAIAAEVRRPTIASLARANKRDIEAAARALENAAKPRIHIVLAASDLHLEHKVRMTRDQALNLAGDSVRHARSFVDEVQYSLEDSHGPTENMSPKSLTLPSKRAQLSSTCPIRWAMLFQPNMQLSLLICCSE
ncbi:MAG: 2-isopropylmalate synthase [Edaphobacter sp.]|nr:2-isopropylmalate synthase [Edaphobacter sp.]